MERETKRQQHRNEIGHPKPNFSNIRIWPELEKQLRADAEKFNVSISFVINTALSVTFGIDVGENYWSPEGYKEPKRKSKVVRFKKSA